MGRGFLCSRRERVKRKRGKMSKKEPEGREKKDKIQME